MLMSPTRMIEMVEFKNIEENICVAQPWPKFVWCDFLFIYLFSQKRWETHVVFKVNT
jgi:hypothetical protein